MKTPRFLPAYILKAASGVLLALHVVSAQAAMKPFASTIPSDVRFVAADCNTIGQSVAAREGGQLRKAVAVKRGERTVCVITYTVPSKGGQPPRRVEKTVEAG